MGAVAEEKEKARVGEEEKKGGVESTGAGPSSCTLLSYYRRPGLVRASNAAK